MPKKTAKRITSIKEIAKLAECSIATVSNALNSKGRISQQVRDNIFNICKEHGYLPNSGGRNLRRGKNETIGLLFYPSCAAIFRNIYYAEIMESLEATVEARGYDLLLSGFDLANHVGEPPRFMRQGKVDGIILLGGFPRIIVKQLHSFGAPLIHLDNHRDEIKIDNVTTDGFDASEQIVDHLVKLGHRRIVYMAHQHEDTNAEQREAGFLAAVERHQLPKTLSVSLRNFAGTTDGYELLQSLMQSKRPPTALICVNDTLAVELLDCLQSDGYDIPGDISIFGFNDDTDSRKSTPSLSTVRVDKGSLGKIGAQTILNRIDNPDSQLISVRLPVELVHRESVGKPPSN
jgi:DNA-binding LacI/PurR family transcriptional regulator